MKDLLNTAIGPFTAKIWMGLLGIVLIAAGTAVVIAKNRDAKLVDTGREAGSAGAVAEGRKIILDQVGKANEAEDQVRRGGDAERYQRCLRYATPDTRANCDALRPMPD